MKRLATPMCLLIGALLALHPGSARAQQLILDYVGFDYEVPAPPPGQFGQLGSGYVGLGVVPNLFAPLVSDTASKQYTYVVSGMTVVNRQTIGSFVVIDYSPGILSIYEDSKSGGTPAVWAPNPPNAQAPGSFTDGALYLQGTLSNFQFVLNTANGSGSYDAGCVWNAGTNLGDIPFGDRTGWTFAGATSNALNIPAGYAHQIDGQNFIILATPARRTSWGGLKSTYR